MLPNSHVHLTSYLPLLPPARLGFGFVVARQDAEASWEFLDPYLQWSSEARRAHRYTELSDAIRHSQAFGGDAMRWDLVMQFAAVEPTDVSA